MATNFPTSTDSYTTKYGGDTISESHVNDIQDAIEALEAKMGVNSSLVVLSHDYKLRNLPAQERNFDIGGYELRARTLQADIATGTAPIIITSTTKVSNLNVEQVDGYDFNQSLLTTDSPTFSGLTLSGLTKCRIYRGTSHQSIPASTITQIRFNAKSYDSLTEADVTSTYRWTAANTGYYIVVAQARLINIADGRAIRLYIYKNGVAHTMRQIHTGSSHEIYVNVVDIIQVNAGQFLDARAYHNDSVARDVGMGSEYTFFTIARFI